VPAVSSGPYRTRLKLSFGTGGALTSGVSFTFGEIEDYLLPAQLCSGCNTFGGPGASLFAADPPRIGGTLNVQTAGALANTGVLTVLGRFAGPGADLAAMGAPIAPGVCFLCVLPQLLFGGGTTDGSGNLTQSFPVPNDLAFQGVTVNLQNFQAVPNGLGGLDVVNTNALVLTVIL
jgi:hypothetical protein